MKSLILSAVFASAAVANAQAIAPNANLEEAFKLVPFCMGAVGVGDGHVARETGAGQVAISTVGDVPSFDLQMTKNVIEFKIKGDTLYALYSDRLQEWSLTDRKMTQETSTSPGTLMFRQGALGMDWHGTDLVIAHGRMGYVVYNTTTHAMGPMVRVLEDQLPKESQLTDVAVQGDQAIFTVSNFTLDPDFGDIAFRGFLVIDLKTGKEVHRAAGIDPGSMTLLIQGNSALVGYENFIQTYSLPEIMSKKKIQIRRSLSKFGRPGHLMGQPAVVGNQIFTCFREDLGPGKAKRMMPLVLDSTPFRL